MFQFRLDSKEASSSFKYGYSRDKMQGVETKILLYKFVGINHAFPVKIFNIVKCEPVSSNFVTM